MNIPARVATRITAALKRYQPILASAKVRDINEADTVTIVKDLLADVFGYDKYTEITSEHAIRGTFCDLAIKIDDALQLLIEVKAIGLDLKDAHVKQAIDYAVNQGVDWVLLTNGITWRAYRVVFAKPIEHELVLEFNLSDVNVRSEHAVEPIWLLAKEGWQKARIGEYHSQKQALSRFMLAAVILSAPVLELIRRELRRVSPDVKIDIEQIAEGLETEVLKREVLEGDKAILAKKQLGKAADRSLRARRVAEPGLEPPGDPLNSTPEPPPVEEPKGMTLETERPRTSQ